MLVRFEGQSFYRNPKKKQNHATIANNPYPNTPRDNIRISMVSG
jgi:hypothetical protein